MGTIIGIDEVGRGCWAGPVVAAAVALDDLLDPRDAHPIRIADSKILTRSQREDAVLVIKRIALGYGIGWVGAEEVDRVGLTQAVRQAMELAYKGLCVKGEIIIDGNINYLAHIGASKAVVKADASVLAVSAASILAKVARDDYMRECAVEYPQYGFDAHVGYGTRRHAAALARHGACSLHRMSFKPLLQYA